MREVIIIYDMSISVSCGKTKWKIMECERHINEAKPGETNAFLLRGSYSKYNVAKSASDAILRGSHEETAYLKNIL